MLRGVNIKKIIFASTLLVLAFVGVCTGFLTSKGVALLECDQIWNTSIAQARVWSKIIAR